MARKQLGATASGDTDLVTKTYTDQAYASLLPVTLATDITTGGPDIFLGTLDIGATTLTITGTLIGLG